MSAPQKQAPIKDHLLSNEEIQTTYATKFVTDKPSTSAGLSPEAIAEKQKEFGLNMMTPPKSVPYWLRYLHCLGNLFNVLLIVSGILCFILLAIDFVNNFPNLYVGIVLIVVANINAVIEFVQIIKSEAALKGFLNLVPRKANVIRGAKLQTIDAQELVPGDILHIRMGDKVPADCYLFWGSEIKADNSSLTGEADPQDRGAGNSAENPLEAHNLVFSGSLIVNGEGYGVVVRTGDNTVLGQIADMVSGEKKRPSPMTAEIDHFVIIIAIVAVITAIIFFIIGMLTIKLSPVTVLLSFNFNFAIGVFVSWVPEGLPAVVTLLLSFAAARMAKRNVLVKELRGVETLGAITILATDKTGTLTRNQMTVTYVWSGGLYDATISSGKAKKEVQPAAADSIKDEEKSATREITQMAPEENYEKFTSEKSSLNEMAMICYLCSKARFDTVEVPIKQRNVIGDATECGLFTFAANTLPDSDKLADTYPKVFEIPFNSTNKFHVSIHKMKHQNGGLTLYIKGAPERVFKLCTSMYDDSGAQVHVGEEQQKEFLSKYELFASKGNRVIGCAKLELDGNQYPDNFVFRKDDDDKKDFGPNKENVIGIYPKTGYNFVGLVSLEDPPKHGVREAIGKCRQAGVKVMMVTGDHPLTAEAIARKINLMLRETKEMVAKRTNRALASIQPHEYDAIVIHGEKVDGLTDEDWELIMTKEEVIFARTSPKHKLQIVKHCQSRGHIVGVTGDGVNDSPALKKADLGISMNISGSDVSKEAAAMILLDDNFASCVYGIAEGRLIFKNLKKSIRYTICHTMPQVFANLLFVVVPLPLPLYALQILLVDLGFEFFLGLSFAWELPESGDETSLMTLLPRKPVNLRSYDLLKRQNAYQLKKDVAIFKTVHGADAEYKPEVSTTFAVSLKYRLAKIQYWFSHLFDKEGWSLWREPKQEETLVDLDVLSYAYLEIGLLETIGCLLAYFHVFYVELGWSPSLVFQNKDSFIPYPTTTRYQEVLYQAESAFYFGILIQQFFNMFMCKVTTRYPFGKMLLKNKFTWYSMILAFAVACFIVYPPFMHQPFQTYTLNPLYWCFPLLMGFVIIAYCTARIAYRRRLIPENINLQLPLDLHPTRFSTRSAK